MDHRSLESFHVYQTSGGGGLYTEMNVRVQHVFGNHLEGSDAWVRPLGENCSALDAHNHREAIAAMDFFTVPTLTFGVLQCFFVIAHDRRRVLHFSITRHPSSAWISQQLRETFPYDEVPTYLIFDRAANFNEEVVSTMKSFGIQP